MWYAVAVSRMGRGWIVGVTGLVIAASGAARTAGADELAFAIGGGRVTLIAAGVPLQAVLDEWARAGDTRFVGAEAIGASPVSLRLEDVAEREALRLLLQPAAGFLAVPRTPRDPGASIYDRVKVRAARSDPRPPASGGSPAPGPARRESPPAPVREAPALSEADQRARLQRLMRPRGAGGAVADAPRGGAAYAPTTPRPGMIAEPVPDPR